MGLVCRRTTPRLPAQNTREYLRALPTIQDHLACASELTQVLNSRYSRKQTDEAQLRTLRRALAQLDFFKAQIKFNFNQLDCYRYYGAWPKIPNFV